MAASFKQESLPRSVENAQRLLASPGAKAFDLSLEPKENFAKYNTSRFIEVTTEYIPFRFRDTHENGHERAAKMKETIDSPVAQLILERTRQN